MQTSDNSFYLNHDFLGQYSVQGAVFLDYRNDASFKDDLSIIYGHRMNGRLMFSDVARYRDNEFLHNHARGELRLRSGAEIALEAKDFLTINAHDDMYKDLDGSGLRGDIVLSTCEKGDAELRDVLVLKVLE